MFITLARHNQILEHANSTWKGKLKEQCDLNTALEDQFAQLVKAKKNEIEDLERKHNHDLEDLERKHTKETAEKALETAQTLKALEYKIKDEYESKVRVQVEELLAKEKKLLTENYETLTGSMKKLHEEGNTSTKFMQELALKTMDSAKQLQAPAAHIENNVGATETTAKKVR